MKGWLDRIYGLYLGLMFVEGGNGDMIPRYWNQVCPLDFSADFCDCFDCFFIRRREAEQTPRGYSHTLLLPGRPQASSFPPSSISTTRGDSSY